MPVEWTQDLSVGVEMIDNQHKELFRKINDLQTAMNEGKGMEVIGELVSFLEDYVVMHFGAEEKYMNQYDYPEYSIHKTAHTWFTKEFSDIKIRVQTDGPVVNLIIRSNNLLVDWLIKHIRKTDRALGDFLKSRI